MCFNRISKRLLPARYLDTSSQAALAAHLDQCFPKARLGAAQPLPRIILWGGWAGRFLTWLGHAQGITFGRHVFWNPSDFPAFNPTHPALEQMGDFLVHEAAHVWQYTRDGTARFLWRYVRDYLLHLIVQQRSLGAAARHRAYLAIPYEVEARWVEKVWGKMQDEG